MALSNGGQNAGVYLKKPGCYYIFHRQKHGTENLIGV